MYNLRNILIFSIGYWLLASIAYAQVVDPVQFIIAPETPGPREQVVIAVQGVGSFLGSATITWRENGTVKLTGIGERTYSFTTGALGSETRVSVSINSPSQGLIERTFLFRPSLVNLVWEADTTAPLFYQGKTRYSAGSTLKVVAFPTVVVSGSRVSDKSLSYQWSRNGEPLSAQSGQGRNSVVFVGDQLQNSEEVVVDVYFGSARVGRGSIIIPAEEPYLLMYERDPLRGVVLDQAIPSAISLNGREITLQAEPYHFAQESKTGGLIGYDWTLNGEGIAGPDTYRGLLTLRQTGEGGGAAVVSVRAQNNDPDRFVQAAESLVQILFGLDDASASSFFGL